MIYKNLHWLHFMVQKMHSLEDEIYPQGKIYSRLRNTGYLYRLDFRFRF